MTTAAIPILIVEDDPSHVLLIERAFSGEAQKYVIAMASTLEAARQRLAVAPPALMLVDMNLPDGAGLDLFHTQGVVDEFPVILMTGQGDEATAVQAIKDGALDYVVKSAVTLNAMPRIVERTLREWRHIQERRHAESTAMRLGQVLEESVNEIYLFDAVNHRFTLVNRGGRDNLGYRMDELELMTPLSIMPEMTPTAFSRLLGTLASGEKRRVRFTTVHARRDGSEYPVEVFVQKSDHPPHPGYVASAIDITERRQVEEERQALQNQLRQAQKMETLGTLSGGLAHDFNNILTPIILNAHMLIGDLVPESPMYARVERIANAARRARDLVQRMVTFSRQQKPQMKPLPIARIVNDALSLVAAAVPPLVKFSQTIECPGALVFCDETQIHQVILNLCTNACHAMGDREGAIGVALEQVSIEEAEASRIGRIPAGSYVRLSVTDTGHGMSEATQARIFEPFFTLKEVGKGTGLGLSVVHGIVLSHGGTITVRSAPGEGARFDVYLPIASNAGEQAMAGEDQPVDGHEHILFVDDEREIAILTQEILQPLGYDVTICTDGANALDLLRARGELFDLVITDQVMPHLTGTELAREILALRPALPIILVTGFSHTVNEKELGRYGIVDIVRKPLLPSELATAVRRALDLAARRHAGEPAPAAPPPQT